MTQSYAVLLQNSICDVHKKNVLRVCVENTNYINLSKKSLMCAFCPQFVLSNVFMCAVRCMCIYRVCSLCVRSIELNFIISLPIPFLIRVLTPNDGMRSKETSFSF